MTDMSWEHAAEARAALNAIVTDPEHGAAALSSPQTMSNLLKDLLPDAPREKGMLVAAAEAGLANTLREHVAQGMDPDTATRLAASSLAISTPFTPEACNWVSGELAIALGISQPTDLGLAAGGAGASYSSNDAPTRGYARPPAQGSGQGTQSVGQGPGQEFGQAGAQGFGQGAGQEFGQSAGQGFGQAGAQGTPQGGFQGFGQADPQSFPQAQGFPQAQSFPEGQSNPQAGFGSFQQAGVQSSPPAMGPGYQQPAGTGFPQAPSFQIQPGSVGPKNNTLAIVALICGVAQFVLWLLILIPGFLSAVAALICGLVSLRQIRARGEGGRGMAITGIVLGVLGVLGGIAWIIIIAVGASKVNNYGQY